MLSRRESEVLDYLRRQANDALIASLPTPHERVIAHLTPETPLPVKTWKGDA